MAKKNYKRTVQNKQEQPIKQISKQEQKLASPKAKNGDMKISITVWYALAVFAVAVLLFARTIPFGMVYCDDDTMIVDDYAFNQDLSNISEAFKQSFFNANDLYYRPILRLTLILDANIGGENPAIYRTTNVAIHAISSLLFFIFLLKLKYEKNTALLISLIFTVHPLISPAVSWISGRNDTLLALFMLFSFIAYINFHENKKSTRWLSFGLHILTFIIALFTKEVAAALPLMILLYIKYFCREKLLSQQNILTTIIWAVIGLIWFLIRQSVLTGRGEANQLFSFFTEALASNYPTIPAVIGKMLLPVRMSGLSNFEAITIISGLAGIAAIVSLTIINKKTDKGRIIFGSFWFLLFISPTLIARIKDFDFDYAEHRVYLPMMGILLIVLEIFRAYRVDFKKVRNIAIAGAITAVFVVITFQYEGYFVGPHAFWGRFVELYPDKTRGYIGLGKQAFINDSMEKVIEIMKQGMAIKADYRFWYANLSSAYIRLNNFVEAEKYAAVTLKLDPEHPEGNYNYAIALMANGKIDQAIPALENAIRYKPDNPKLFVQLGEAYAKKGKYQDAELAIQEAIRLAPNAVEPYMNLANIYGRMNRQQDMDRAFATATQINPNNVKLYLNIGTIYAKQNRYDKAEEMWTTAYKLDSRIPETLMNLTMLYKLKGDMKTARKYGMEALQNGGKLPPELMMQLGL